MHISLVLALALLASELLPAWLTRVDRRDSDLGISTTFAMALVITGPIGFAVGLRVVLSLVTGLRDGLPARRMFAEAARWASAMALGRILYATATHQTILGTNAHMAARDLPWALAAAGVVFIVHYGLQVTHALDDVRRRHRQELMFGLSTSGLLLMFAPVVVATL